MEIDVGSLRCLAPALGIPPHRHYDPTDAEDAALRMEWAKLLFRAGYRLRYPQETTGTAVLLFHRFLIRERVAKHRSSRSVILTTCLFLAGKVTESPRRLRDVINVLHMVTSEGQDEPPVLDKAYWTMKERIVEFEQVLLRTINFQVDPPDPHRLLLNYARSLRLNRAATRTAWSLVNDVLFCPRALSAPPPAVACAAIRIAARIHVCDRRLRWFSPPSRRRKRRRDGSGGMDGGETPPAANMTTNDSSGSVGQGRSDGTGQEVSVPRSKEAAPRLDGDFRKKSPDASSSVDRDQEEGSAARERPAAAEGDDTVRSEAGGNGVSGDGEADDDDESPTISWWRLFDVRDEEVDLVCSELLALYRTHGDGVSAATADDSAADGNDGYGQNNSDCEIIKSSARDTAGGMSTGVNGIDGGRSNSQGGLLRERKETNASPREASSLNLDGRRDDTR